MVSFLCATAVASGKVFISLYQFSGIFEAMNNTMWLKRFRKLPLKVQMTEFFQLHGVASV